MGKPLPLPFYFLSYSFFFFFTDRLSQRDLGNYKTDLHQIVRDGRHVGADVQSGIGFRTGQGMLPWQPILGAKSAEIGDTPSFLGLAFHNGFERICAKFTRKTCLVLRSDNLECQGQKSKVKVTRDKTRHALAVWMEWNGLVADNVVQAAGASI